VPRRVLRLPPGAGVNFYSSSFRPKAFGLIFVFLFMAKLKLLTSFILTILDNYIM
jgi:hypothetical protein